MGNDQPKPAQFLLGLPSVTRNPRICLAPLLAQGIRKPARPKGGKALSFAGVEQLHRTLLPTQARSHVRIRLTWEPSAQVHVGASLLQTVRRLA